MPEEAVTCIKVAGWWLAECCVLPMGVTNWILRPDWRWAKQHVDHMNMYKPGSAKVCSHKVAQVAIAAAAGLAILGLNVLAKTGMTKNRPTESA